MRLIFLTALPLALLLGTMGCRSGATPISADPQPATIGDTGLTSGGSASGGSGSGAPTANFPDPDQSAPELNDLPVASPTQTDWQVTTVANGLEHPWAVAFLPDGSLLVTERRGRLRRVDPDGNLAPDPIQGVPAVVAKGQGGLLDLIVHPDYEANGWLYFSYAAAGEGGAGTRVARARLEDNSLTDLEVLLDMSRKTGSGVHFGSRLAFGADGHLYIGTGDRGDRNRSQDLGDHAGKVLRITEAGEIPPDNPFVGEEGALPEVFSWGHRNIQGMVTHPETGVVWANEHGPQGGDEVNVLEPGLNYGWPIITHGREYSGGQVGQGISEQPGLQQPVLHWTPSIAPSGMAFYTGDAFPEWQGDIFVGALVQQHLARLVVEGDQIVAQERLLDQEVGRIRDVRQGPDGLIYLLTDERNGALLRLEPV